MIRHALWIVAVVVAVLLGPAIDVAWAKKKDKTEDTAEFGDAALGRVYHERLIATLGVYEDKRLGDYVYRLGSELAAVAENNDYPWHFTVLDVDMVNAFALPGGYIYITRGLLAQLNSEAQLAAVLGHEIGHVTARHAARQHMATSVVGKVTGAMAGPSGEFNLGTLFGAGLVRGYGREMELEADQTGAELVAKLGYHPDAALEVLAAIKAFDDYMSAMSDEPDDGLGGYHAMLSSHPEKERRMAELIANAAGTSPTPARDNGRERYLDIINGLAIDGSTQQGVLRGNVMYHKGLNMAVTFPTDWEVANLPDRLVATPPSGDAAMIMTVLPQKMKRVRRVKVDQFLQKRMGMRRWQNSSHEDIHGNPAFVTLAPKARTAFGERLARVGVIYHGESAFVFSGATEDAERQRKYDSEFLSTIKSFRPIGPDEAAYAEPRRLKIISMPADQTLAELAEQSPFATEPLLRQINGLYTGGEPQPGQSVKVVD